MMMIEYAAEMYVRERMICAYGTIIAIIIGIIISVVLYFKKRRNENPITFFIMRPKLAHDCLNDEKWVAKNPNFSKKLQKELEKRGL